MSDDFGSRLRLDFAREFDSSRSHSFRELTLLVGERSRENTDLFYFT